MTSKDSSNAIFSQGSAVGHLRPRWRTSQTTFPFGREVAHAKASAPQASEKDSTTNDTSGQSSLISSASADLQSSLESRLRQRLDTVGSILYRQTWREKATPQGRRYLAHTASAKTISVSDCIGLGNWNTPRSTDGTKGGPNQTGGALPADAAMAAWHTPLALSSEKRAGGNNSYTNQVTSLAAWMTPKSSEHQTTQKRGNLTLNGQALSSAATERPEGLVLNPAFSGWLMGYPPAWDVLSPGFALWADIQAELSKEK